MEEFESYLRERYQLPPPAAKEAAGAMLARFRERSFILVRYGADVYGFVHRAFQEYFCADEIVPRFHYGRELTPEQLTEQVFGRHWADEEWQEVLLLVAGMIDSRFAARVVDHLLDRANPLSALVPDVPPQNVLLALRCLAEVRNASTVIRQGEAVLDAVISLLEHSHGRYALEVNQVLDRLVIRVLAAVGSRWPGRSRYRDWFTARGGFIDWSPTSSLIARITAALFPDTEECATCDDSAVRRAAVQAVAAGLGSHDRLGPLLRDRAANDPEPNVRHVARQALGSLDTADTHPVPR